MSGENISIRKRTTQAFIARSLSLPWIFFILAIMSLLISVSIYYGYWMIPVAIIALLGGSIFLYYCLFEPFIGYFLVTLLAFFAFYPDHFLSTEIPLSTAVEILVWFVFLGSFREKPPLELKNDLLHTGLSVVFIVYTGYHIIEFFNPDMYSKAGYIFIMRKFVMFALIYIMAYRIINTPRRFRFFLKFWLIMAFVAALYGCYQQWFGYLPPERRYITRNPVLYGLLFQGGTLRKFSFLSDVVSFGVLSGSMAVLAIILGINTKKKKLRFGLFFAALIMLLGMVYSGTRTATLILPMGISLYLILTIRNKTTLITLFAFLMGALFILYAPIYNPTLQRIRSTFNSENASLNVRDVNRHYIQPYIHDHPIGGGLATSGVAGRQYNPGHPLAGFPPDSGLLKIALELGWIGLGLTIVFYLAMLYQCIYYSFRIINPEYKIYAVGIACTLFSIMVTQYSQVSVGQIPGVFFFMSTISIVKRLREFDTVEQSGKHVKLPDS